MDSKTCEATREQAEFCKVFGNTTRLLILRSLGNNEKSVSEIAVDIHASLPNVSQHLRLMRDKGILSLRREGNIIYYRIVQELFEERCLHLMNIMKQAPSSSSTTFAVVEVKQETNDDNP